MTIKEQNINEYQKFNDAKRAEFDKKSFNVLEEGFNLLKEYASKNQIPENDLFTLEEAVRENIIIEALYAYPEDAQKVISLSRARIGTYLKLLIENNTAFSELYGMFNNNTGSQPIKDEQEDLLKHLRFIIRYNNINRPDPLLNEQ